MVEDLRSQGKQIAGAVIELITARFAFSPDAAYPPEDPTA